MYSQAVKVTEEMAGKFLGYKHDHLTYKRDQLTYLKSMFLCVTPESLTPLATLMYQKFEKSRSCPLPMVFQYEDAKKVDSVLIPLKLC